MAMKAVNVADGGGRSTSTTINKVASNIKSPTVMPKVGGGVKLPPININDKLKGGNTLGTAVNKIKTNTTNAAANIKQQAAQQVVKAKINQTTNTIKNNISNTFGSQASGGNKGTIGTAVNQIKTNTTNAAANVKQQAAQQIVKTKINKVTTDVKNKVAGTFHSTTVSTGCGGVSHTIISKIDANGNKVDTAKSKIKDLVDKKTIIKTGIPSTGCGPIKEIKPISKDKKINIPLTTSDGKKLSKKATGFLKDGAAIVASGALAGPLGAGVATTVIAGKTLVANAPALRENANKAKQIAQDLLGGLKKSQQTLDTLNEKWQGSDAKKYIESTKEKLQNLEIISQVMELYQRTSEQAARKVEETQQAVSQFVDNMRNN